MATKADLIEQKNDDDSAKNSIKNKAIELSTFTKYSVMVPELRKPIIDYSTLTTLKNYAECSKLCSSEVRSLKNTIAPETLDIYRIKDEVMLSLGYKNHTIGKSFELGCSNIWDLEDFVMKAYQKVNRGKTETIYMDVTEWPGRIMQIKQLTEVDYCQIYMYATILDNFLAFSKTTKLKVNWLNLMRSEKEQTEMVLPSEFFKTDFMKNVSKLYTSIQFQSLRNDFVNNSLEFLRVKNWVDPHLIQEKILKINETRNHKRYSLRVFLPPDDSREFDFDVILPANRFPDRQIRQFRCQIGSVGVLISKDKKTLEIRFTQHPE